MSRSLTSLLLTGYIDGLESVRKNVDSVPYEKFPYCCSSNHQDKEIDITKKPVQQQPPEFFWTNERITRCLGVKSSYSSSLSIQALRLQNEQIIRKFEDLKDELEKEVNIEYQESMKKPQNDQISYEEFEEMLQQINYDIAWKIYDEVNQYNEQDQVIDLNCLDIQDAQAILKHKLCDLGKAIREGQILEPGEGPQDDHVLCVVCSEDHFKKVGNKQGVNKALKNMILEMVRNELQIDHFYRAQTRTIFIRVNMHTLDNPVLKEQ